MQGKVDGQTHPDFGIRQPYTSYADVLRGETMGKKLPTTPRSKVRNALRQVFLRSRERYAAGKSANWTCELCGKKQSKAKGKEVKVEIHHRGVISNWNDVLDAVYEKLLVSPDKLQCLCRSCHLLQHGDKKVR